MLTGAWKWAKTGHFMGWWKDREPMGTMVRANESSIYFRMFSCHVWKNLAVLMIFCWISDQGAPFVGQPVVLKIEIGNPPVVIVIATWLWINTYENTIFRGMNIHKSQLNFDVNRRGTRFWPTATCLFFYSPISYLEFLHLASMTLWKTGSRVYQLIKYFC